MTDLTKIQIDNYKSIDSVSIDCSPLADGSRTFGLIGLNEAGKSSFLRGVSLLAAPAPIPPKDLHHKSEGLNIVLRYTVTAEEFRVVADSLASQHEKFDETKYNGTQITFWTSFQDTGSKKKLYIGLIKLEKDDDFDWYPVGTFFKGYVQSPIFWTASEKYMISRPIDLTEFAADPQSTSIPLRNCFLLAGIEDIADRIASIQSDSTEIEQLQRELGSTVTQHIQKVWPDHPIEISFVIVNNAINFHVRDKGSDGRAKTADQRSDGFRQFVSFLLTVSAQNKNKELSNSILLLDEPETHLHPLAQEYLLNELVELTKNDRNNVVIFATHSNYMIDKNDLSRNYKVYKAVDETAIERFSARKSTYASVSYEVFKIPSTDYHNELYGALHEKYQLEDSGNADRSSIKNFDEEVLFKRHSIKKNRAWKGSPNQATLPTFIRNCIHHPESGGVFSQQELEKSIQSLRKLAS